MQYSQQEKEAPASIISYKITELNGTIRHTNGEKNVKLHKQKHIDKLFILLFSFSQLDISIVVPKH